ncbi:DUF239 domain protein [Medicago truncatula]|uniref:DUF239 domain protein n=1 Tax=Medicago truncatula TaxID=3880 RepID=A0A072U328_MEDTR|nr:DUF239 domain protein [Medicago truncatula]
MRNISGGEREIWWFPLYCCLTLSTTSSFVTVSIGAESDCKRESDKGGKTVGERQQGRTDAYEGTGCYNSLCSDFVQTTNKIAIGAAISPTSTYNGGQFDISLMTWKNPLAGDAYCFC